MHKYFKIILPMSILFCCPFLFTLHLGSGYAEIPEPEQTLPSDFFQHLQNITGTLFIGPDPKILQTYQQFLSGTKDTLQLQTYELTHPIFKSAFQHLATDGVDVQIILEDDKYQQYQNGFKQLQELFSGTSNLQLKSDEQMGTTYTHSKITLNPDAFRIQTANLTKSSFESNREHFFFSSNPAIHQNLKELFARDREGIPLSSDQFHPNLVVCPINCRVVIEALLSTAKESILIQTQYILDENILQLLRQQPEHIALNIIIADTIENAELTHYFGPRIARALPSHYNHTKMILIDNTYLLLGSMNLSANSLDNNREIGILLLDPSLIQTFVDGFRNDWKSSV